MNKQKTQYIGITDFENPQQVRNMIKHVPLMSQIKLHVGVMTSKKVLSRQETKWAKAWLPPDKLHQAFIEDPQVYNVLHYADYENERVEDTLIFALKLVGKHVQALQLDMVWPDPRDIRSALIDTESPVDIILQIGKNAFDIVKESDDWLLRRIGSYGERLSHVLLDLSMGKGKAMDVDFLRPYIEKIHIRFPDMGIVVAGGLGPDSMDLAKPLIKDYGEFLSIDAQGQLRSSGSGLDPIEWDRAEKYLKEAFMLYSLYQPFR